MKEVSLQSGNITAEITVWENFSDRMSKNDYITYKLCLNGLFVVLTGSAGCPGLIFTCEMLQQRWWHCTPALNTDSSNIIGQTNQLEVRNDDLNTLAYLCEEEDPKSTPSRHTRFTQFLSSRVSFLSHGLYFYDRCTLYSCSLNVFPSLCASLRFLSSLHLSAGFGL